MTHKNFLSSNHTTGTAEPTFIKFCTRVGYINSNNRITYHPQKGRGYGHVTVLKFYRLPRCSASRWFSAIAELLLVFLCVWYRALDYDDSSSAFERM